jgi:hypothetical protein
VLSRRRPLHPCRRESSFCSCAGRDLVSARVVMQRDQPGRERLLDGPVRCGYHRFVRLQAATPRTAAAAPNAALSKRFPLANAATAATSATTARAGRGKRFSDRLTMSKIVRTTCRPKGRSAFLPRQFEIARCPQEIGSTRVSPVPWTTVRPFHAPSWRIAQRPPQDSDRLPWPSPISEGSGSLTSPPRRG